MRLDEAKEILNKNGFITEAKSLFDVEAIRQAIYRRFDPDFGGLNNWSVETGNNGKTYVYHRKNQCVVTFHKMMEMLDLNFGDGNPVTCEFDSDNETLDEFIKIVLNTIKEYM